MRRQPTLPQALAGGRAAGPHTEVGAARALRIGVKIEYANQSENANESLISFGKEIICMLLLECCAFRPAPSLPRPLKQFQLIPFIGETVVLCKDKSHLIIL